MINTGSPMYEVLHHYLPKIERSDVLAQLGLTGGTITSSAPTGRRTSRRREQFG